MSTQICDFCSEPNPVWSLRCESFKIENVGVSLGDWLACDRCKELAVAGEWRKLAEISSEKTETGQAMVGIVGKERTIAEVMKLQAEFRKRFSGDARRIES